MKNICFICAKQYQILNALNFAYQNRNENTNIDLYISKMVYDYEVVKNNLINSGLFKNVFVYKYLEFEYKGKFWHLNRTLVRIFGLLFPKQYIKRITLDNVKIKKGQYDEIYTESLNHTVVPFLIVNNKKKPIMIDDGTGSYTGDRFFNNYSSQLEWKLLNLLYHYRIKKHDLLNPDTIYLNNKNVATLTWTNNVFEFCEGDYDAEYIELLKKVFSYEGAEYYDNYQVIYLGQYNYCNISDKAFNDKMRGILNGFGNEILLRPHPVEFSYYEGVDGVTIDRKYNLWELICIDYIDESKILISSCSSAMCMPKIFSDKEPTIIFTYPLFKDNTSARVYSDIEKVYDMMYKSYRDKRKVLRVDSKEELDSLVDKLKVGE